MNVLVHTWGSYRHLWDSSVFVVLDEGELVALHDVQEPVEELHSQFSTQDFMRTEIFEVEDEDNLVQILRTFKTDKIGFSRFVEIDLIFNERSAKYVGLVLDSLKQTYGSMIAKCDISVVETFAMEEEGAFA